jgi:2-methylisocitrate lyase-like PEP mutase family enzyme
LGATDGEQIEFQSNLNIVKTIVDHVKIPVSADIESGYGKDWKTIVENVLRTADVGVAGINLEDSLKGQSGLREVEEHCHLLSKIRTALDNYGFSGFFINARIDTYFQKKDPLAETISRANAYVESGASGIFVPGLKDDDEIRAVAAEVDAPLNILSLPGLTNAQRLQELGVKRFSFGNAFSDKVIEFLEKSAAQLYESQDTAPLYE